MTFIELLLVIVIVAVLIALLFPALQNVAENGRRVKCASNLRQCGAALFSYAADHAGSLPPAGSDGPADPLDTYSTDLVNDLTPYIDFRVWQCPEITAPTIDSSANTGFISQRCSYQYLPYHTPISGPVNSGKLSDQTASTVLMQDIIYFYFPSNAWRSNHSTGGIYTTNTYPTNPSFATYFGGAPKGMNSLFGDGHVMWLDLYTMEPGWIYWGTAKTPVLATN